VVTEGCPQGGVWDSAPGASAPGEGDLAVAKRKQVEGVININERKKGCPHV